MKRISLTAVFIAGCFIFAQAQEGDSGYVSPFAVPKDQLKTYSSSNLGANKPTGRYLYDTALIRYIKADNYDSVRTLLQANVDVNEKNDEGFTPLCYAGEVGNIKVIEMLTERGANVNVTCTYELTPLIAAAANGHHETVKVLLEYDADKEAEDILGKTAIIHAAENGHLKAVKILQQHGAQLNTIDYKGDSALTLAVKNGHEDVAFFLYDRGADVEVADGKGDSVYTLVNYYLSPKSKLAKALAKNPPANRSSAVDNTGIHVYAEPSVPARTVAAQNAAQTNMDAAQMAGDTAYLSAAPLTTAAPVSGFAAQSDLTRFSESGVQLEDRPLEYSELSSFAAAPSSAQTAYLDEVGAGAAVTTASAVSAQPGYQRLSDVEQSAKDRGYRRLTNNTAASAPAAVAAQSAGAPVAEPARPTRVIRRVAKDNFSNPNAQEDAMGLRPAANLVVEGVND